MTRYKQDPDFVRGQWVEWTQLMHGKIVGRTGNQIRIRVGRRTVKYDLVQGDEMMFLRDPPLEQEKP